MSTNRSILHAHADIRSKLADDKHNMMHTWHLLGQMRLGAKYLCQAYICNFCSVVLSQQYIRALPANTQRHSVNNMTLNNRNGSTPPQQKQKGWHIWPTIPSHHSKLLRFVGPVLCISVQCCMFSNTCRPDILCNNVYLDVKVHHMIGMKVKKPPCHIQRNCFAPVGRIHITIYTHLIASQLACNVHCGNAKQQQSKGYCSPYSRYAQKSNIQDYFAMPEQQSETI